MTPLPMKNAHLLSIIGMLMFLERFIQYGYKTMIFTRVSESNGIGYYHEFSAILSLSAVMFSFIGDRVNSSKLIIFVLIIHITGLLISWYSVHEDSIEIFNYGFGITAVGCGGIVMLIPTFGRIYIGNQSFFYYIKYFVNFGCFSGLALVKHFTDKKEGKTVYSIHIISSVFIFIGFLSFFLFFNSSKNNHKYNTSRSKELNNKDSTGTEGVGQMSTISILLLLTPIIPYFSMKEQYNSTWRKLAGNLNDFYFLQKGHVPTLQPILLCLTIPFVMRIPLSMPYKMIIGYYLASLSFFVCLIIEKIRNENTSVLIMFIPLILLTIGETMCYTTSEEYIYLIAPKNRKFLVLSFIRLMSTVGNLIVSHISKKSFFNELSEKFLLLGFFGLFGTISYAIALLMFEGRRKIKQNTFEILKTNI